VLLFALLGMALLGGKWDSATDPDAPRLSFNDIGIAMVSVFGMLTGE